MAPLLSDSTQAQFAVAELPELKEVGLPIPQHEDLFYCKFSFVDMCRLLHDGVTEDLHISVNRLGPQNSFIEFL